MIPVRRPSPPRPSPATPRGRAFIPDALRHLVVPLALLLICTPAAAQTDGGPPEARSIVRHDSLTARLARSPRDPLHHARLFDARWYADSPEVALRHLEGQTPRAPAPVAAWLTGRAALWTEGLAAALPHWRRAREQGLDPFLLADALLEAPAERPDASPSPLMRWGNGDPRNQHLWTTIAAIRRGATPPPLSTIDSPAAFRVAVAAALAGDDAPAAEERAVVALEHPDVRDNVHAHLIFTTLRSDALKAQRRYEESLPILEQALAEAVNLDDLRITQRIETRMGQILRYLNRPREAERHYRAAIAIGHRLGMDPVLHPAWLGLGQALYNLQDYTNALSAYQRADDLAAVAGDAAFPLKTGLLRGDIYKDIGQDRLAAEAYGRAYDLARAHDERGYQLTLQRRQAGLLRNRGRYGDAIVVYREILRDTPSPINRSLIHWLVANSFFELDALDSAAVHYTEGARLAEAARYAIYSAYNHRGLGEVAARRQRFDEALSHYRDAAEAARTTRYPPIDIDILQGIAAVRFQQGALDSAIAGYRRAVALIEANVERMDVEQLKIGYFSGVSSIFQQLANVYMARHAAGGDPAALDSAFVFSERARGRSLRDWEHLALRDGAADSAAMADYRAIAAKLERVQRDRRLAAMEAAPAARADSLERTINSLRYSLIAHSLRLIAPDSGSTPARVAPVAALQAELARIDAALLMYHLTDEAAFAMVLRGDTLAAVPLDITTDRADSLVATLMRPFHQLEGAALTETVYRADIAATLYALLVAPVEAALSLPRTLCVVPDIALMDLPFEMLLRGRPDRPAYTPLDPPDYAGLFLQQRYDLAYLPAASLLLRPGRVPASRPRVLIFANPFGTATLADASPTRNGTRTWRFAPLVYGEQEARRIEAGYDRTRILRRDAATESRFFAEAPDFDILHIATHGVFDTTFDAFTGLVMAMGEGDGDDGLLMGYELAGLRLDCDLVTLSACETGRGKRLAGEGIMGLPRLLMGAGAQSVLMSHWKVDDRFTAALMPRVYAHLLQTGLSKAAALAESKREVLAETPGGEGPARHHPVYWASFTLYGGPGQGRGTERHLPLALVVTGVVAAAVLGAWLWRRR